MLEPTCPSESCRVGETLLRRYRGNDGPGFYALVSRNAERLAQYFPGVMQQATSLDGAARYVAERRSEWDHLRAFFYAVCDAESGEQIGQVRFKTIDWAVGSSEIAYFIDQGFEGRRHMSTALRALLAIGFSELGLQKVSARVTPHNERSRRLLERCGFEEAGVLLGDFRTAGGETADVLCFSLGRERWRIF